MLTIDAINMIRKTQYICLCLSEEMIIMYIQCIHMNINLLRRSLAASIINLSVCLVIYQGRTEKLTEGGETKGREKETLFFVKS